MIRRFIHVLIIFSFMLSYGEMRQWVRIPVLIHHYIEHQASASAPFSWREFIALHYGKAIEHPDDQHHDHEKLPFLSHHSPTLFTPLIARLPALLGMSCLILPAKRLFTDSPIAIISRFSSPIWHPPTV